MWRICHSEVMQIACSNSVTFSSEERNDACRLGKASGQSKFLTVSFARRALGATLKCDISRVGRRGRQSGPDLDDLMSDLAIHRRETNLESGGGQDLGVDCCKLFVWHGGGERALSNTSSQ